MIPSLRILFIEDLPTDQELAAWQLREGGLDFTSLRVDTEEAFLRALDDFQPDLIISDYSMPEFDGMQALNLTLEMKHDIPFIVLTGSMNEETAVACIQAGASDYVIKEHIQRLPFAVQEALKQHRIRKEKTLAEESLRESEIRLTRAQRIAHIGSWSIYVPTRQLDWSEEMYRIFGIPLSTPVTVPEFEHVFSPEELERFNMAVNAAIKDDVPFNIDYKINFPDGSVRYIHDEGEVVRDGEGKPIWMHGAAQDITDRKETEERVLRQSEELQRRNRELARLYHTSGSLISTKPFDLPVLAQAIVDTVVREFEVSNCSLYIIKKHSNNLTRLAYAGEVSKKYLGIQLTLDGLGLIAVAIRTQHVVNVPDVHSHPDYFNGWDEARSELVIPLYLNDMVIGAIDLESDQLAYFTSDDERLLQIFANQAAIVLENTNLIEETNLQVQRLNSLRIIDGAINSSLDITLTASVLLEQITNQLNVDAADILLFNPFTKSLQYVNGRGFTTAALQRTDLRLGQGLAGRAANERQIVHVCDLSSGDEFFKNSPYIKEEHFVEYYGVPLISKGTINGVLEIFHRSRLKEESSWLDFMGTLAGQAAIAIDNIRMFEDLQNSNNELMMAYDATIEGWSRALEVRDQETEGHTRRVTEITMRLAKAVGIKGEELVHIRRGALLHDIGKMGIADSILLKPGPLTDEEWIAMRKHPDFAFEMLSPIAFLKPAMDIPYCHHEKWDGSGYPRGLKGEQIPLAARLFAVADVWDALTSDRPYRKAWSESQAIEYIREQAGKQFDPQAIELFMNNYLFEESPMVKPTILIVDDEESVTRSLARSLKDHFTILTANSGDDALRIAERSDLAVVLTDQRMPGMGGVELLERIRAIKPKSVGILISGYSDVVALTAAINLSNVRGFIPKPWDLDSLRRKLEDAVAQYREMSRGLIIQE